MVCFGYSSYLPIAMSCCPYAESLGLQAFQAHFLLTHYCSNTSTGCINKSGCDLLVRMIMVSMIAVRAMHKIS